MTVYFDRVSNKLCGIDEEFLSSLEEPCSEDILEIVVSDIEKTFRDNPDKSGHNLTSYVRTALRRKIAKHSQADQRTLLRGRAASASHQTTEKTAQEGDNPRLEQLRSLCQKLVATDAFQLWQSTTTASDNCLMLSWKDKEKTSSCPIPYSDGDFLNKAFRQMKNMQYPAACLYEANHIFGLKKHSSECVPTPIEVIEKKLTPEEHSYIASLTQEERDLSSKNYQKALKLQELDHCNRCCTKGKKNYYLAPFIKGIEISNGQESTRVEYKDPQFRDKVLSAMRKLGFPELNELNHPWPEVYVRMPEKKLNFMPAASKYETAPPSGGKEDFEECKDLMRQKGIKI